MRYIEGIPVYGTEIDEGALSQIKNCAKSAFHVALMADHHKGYAVPIGGVVAYEDAISPSGVGFDIACGNKAVLTDADAKEIRRNIATIMDNIWKTVSFGVGRKNDDERVDHALFDDPAWSLEATKPLKEKARGQLGTVGSGNHYVDIFTDEQDRVWVGVHFGSRGLGHKTATWFLKAAGAKDGMDVDPCILPTASDLGAQYLDGMHLAGLYAYAGRDWVCSRVTRILGASPVYEVHNHHNFAWKEVHQGKALWVVRKGATPAYPGQEGFVGGSMGDISVIIEGVEHEGNKDTLYSTVHGAGRVMSRTEAAGKMKRGNVWACGIRGCDGSLPIQTERGEDGSNPKCPKCGGKTHKQYRESRIRDGKVSPEMMLEWVKKEGVELRGAGTDESPHCYKRLPEVLAEHSDSIKILHTLRPIGVAMAGADTFDPFKD